MGFNSLDFYFPFIVFLYGIVFVVLTENRYCMEFFAKNPYLRQRFQLHQKTSWICFFAGGLWSLQNLFL